MNFLQMLDKRTTLTYLRIVHAGYEPGQLFWKARASNWWKDFKGAVRDWNLYRAIGVINVTRSTDIYLHYCRPEQAAAYPYFGEHNRTRLNIIGGLKNNAENKNVTAQIEREKLVDTKRVWVNGVECKKIDDADLEGRLTTGCDFPS